MPNIGLGDSPNKMKFKEIKDKIKYNDLITKQKHSQFLQSWEWGEFLEAKGFKVFRYGIFENEKLKFVIQFYKNKLPFGMTYFYAPRIGIKFLRDEEIVFLFDEIKKIAKKEKVMFFRFEPRSELKLKTKKSKIKKTIDLQANKTLILDISGDEDQILKNMHSKTRYNIRLSKRKGVKVRKGSNSDFEKFWEIMKETVKRDGFKIHPKEHYKKMCSLESTEFLVAEYKDKIIAGVIISYFGNMGVYVHGASSNEHRNVMAPYLLQWEAIKRAKEKNCSFYDFNGTDEKKWPGVTRFKKGFKGEEIIYPGAFDFIFSKKYFLYIFLRKLRRIF